MYFHSCRGGKTTLVMQRKKNGAKSYLSKIQTEDYLHYHLIMEAHRIKDKGTCLCMSDL